MAEDRLQRLMAMQVGQTPTYNLYGPTMTLPVEKEPESEEEAKSKLSEMLDEETLFRFAYVPFVIAELCWDYADTVIDMAILCKKDGTKKLSRKIKELRKEYDRYHDNYIDRQHKDGEIDNMIVYEEGVREITRLFLVNLDCELRSAYPDLIPNDRDLITAVYECLIVLKSLYRYAHLQTLKIKKIVGHRIGQILPKEIRALEPLVEAFAGDKPVRDQFKKQMQDFVNTFATQMALVELNSVKEE